MNNMYDFINVILYSFGAIVSIYLAHKYSDNLRKLYFKRTIDEVNEEMRIRNEIILHDIKTMTDPIYPSEGSSYFDTSSQELFKYKDGQWRNSGYKLSDWSEASRFTMMKDTYDKIDSNAIVSEMLHGMLTFVGSVNKFEDIDLEFPNPQKGYLVHINNDNKDVIYDGDGWRDIGYTTPINDNIKHIDVKDKRNIHKRVNCINCGAPAGKSDNCEYCGSSLWYNEEE